MREQRDALAARVKELGNALSESARGAQRCLVAERQLQVPTVDTRWFVRTVRRSPTLQRHPPSCGHLIVDCRGSRTPGPGS